MPARPSTSRRAAVVPAVVLGLLGAGAALAPPAHADTVGVTTAQGFFDAVRHSCPAAGETRTVVLQADVLVSAGLACRDVIVDLNGKTLGGGVYANSSNLSFVDSRGGGTYLGDLAVGTYDDISGRITIGSGTFRPSSVWVADGGSLTVAGGTFTATGTPGERFEDDMIGEYISPAQPGVSLLPSGRGTPSFRVSGGTVTVAGAPGVDPGTGSAAIGGAEGEPGGHVAVSGGTLTATSPVSAIGAGSGSTSSGTLSVVGGTLRIPSGEMRVYDHLVGPEVTVGANGVIAGSADGASHATWSGDGRVDNGGSIRFPAAKLTGQGVDVTGRHYVVSFDTDGGGALDPLTVFAATAQAGGLTLPTPTRGTETFAAWRTATAGGGTVVTDATELTGSSIGAPVTSTLHATYEQPAFTIEKPVITGTARVDEQLTCTPAATTPSDAEVEWRVPRRGTVADGSTITPGGDLRGAKLRCVVTATQGASTASARATSPKVAAGLAGVYEVRFADAAGSPLRGRPQPVVGETLRAGLEKTSGSGTGTNPVDGPGLSVVYAWYVDGERVARSTSGTFTPSADQVGEAISVRVTVAPRGYERSVATAATRRVRAAG